MQTENREQFSSSMTNLPERPVGCNLNSFLIHSELPIILDQLIKFHSHFNTICWDLGEEVTALEKKIIDLYYSLLKASFTCLYTYVKL